MSAPAWALEIVAENVLAGAAALVIAGEENRAILVRFGEHVECRITLVGIDDKRSVGGHFDAVLWISVVDHLIVIDVVIGDKMLGCGGDQALTCLGVPGDAAGARAEQLEDRSLAASGVDPVMKDDDTATGVEVVGEG